MDRLNRSPGFFCPRSEGAFCVYPSGAGVIVKRTPQSRAANDEDFMRYLPEAEGVQWCIAKPVGPRRKS